MDFGPNFNPSKRVQYEIAIKDFGTQRASIVLEDEWAQETKSCPNCNGSLIWINILGELRQIHCMNCHFIFWDRSHIERMLVGWRI